MPTKDETAQSLADSHFALDDGVRRIFRILESDEGNDLRPVKLLEVSATTTEAGISPVGFSADPARNVFYSSVIIEVSPKEIESLQRGKLQLPYDWRLGDELFPRISAARNAS
jgi:hypothetical protein